MTWNEMKDLWRHVTGRVKSAWNGPPRNHPEPQVGGAVAELRVETSKPQDEKVDHFS